MIPRTRWRDTSSLCLCLTRFRTLHKVSLVRWMIPRTYRYIPPIACYSTVESHTTQIRMSSLLGIYACSRFNWTPCSMHTHTGTKAQATSGWGVGLTKTPHVENQIEEVCVSKLVSGKRFPEIAAQENNESISYRTTVAWLMDVYSLTVHTTNGGCRVWIRWWWVTTSVDNWDEREYSRARLGEVMLW